MSALQKFESWLDRRLASLVPPARGGVPEDKSATPNLVVAIWDPSGETRSGSVEVAAPNPDRALVTLARVVEMQLGLPPGKVDAGKWTRSYANSAVKDDGRGFNGDVEHDGTCFTATITVVDPRQARKTD